MKKYIDSIGWTVFTIAILILLLLMMIEPVDIDIQKQLRDLILLSWAGSFVFSIALIMISRYIK